MITDSFTDWVEFEAGWLCLDCNGHTLEMDEYYMVQFHVWKEANPENDGMLCISCLEKRLGRILVPDDFLDCPLNQMALYQTSGWSPLILSRMLASPSQVISE